MGSDQLALLLLAVALLVGLLGTWDALMGRARAEELRERSLGAPPASLTRRAVARLEALVARTRTGRRLGLRLSSAGVRRTPLEFLCATLALGLAGYAVTSLLFPWLIALLVGLAAVRGAFLWLERRHEQRRRAFVGQLPELARLLSNGTSAGLGVNAALSIAAQELDDPASTELSIVLEEVRIGSAFDLALSHLGDRMPSRELGVLVNTLVVQARAGGDLVSALGDMARTLDTRKETIREIRTLMSGAVSTAYVVAALGVGSIFLIDAIKPGSLDQLTHSPLGLLILAVTLSLYATAFVVIRRITRVET